MTEFPTPYLALFDCGRAGPDIPYPHEASMDFERDLRPLMRIADGGLRFIDNEWFYA